MIGKVRFRGAAHLAGLGCAWLSAMLVLQLAPPVFAAGVQAQSQHPGLATEDASSDAESRAIQQAATGAVLAELALRCHWQTDEAFIAKAKGMALLIAVADVAPSSRQLALMVRILESSRMSHHREVAADQVAAGACTSAQSRALWLDLQNLTLANAGSSTAAPAAPPPPASHP